MTAAPRLLVFLSLIPVLKPSGAFVLPGLEQGGDRKRRAARCRERLEYLRDNVCCLNCPAGQRLMSPCTQAGLLGTCVKCEDGTYMEYSNNERQCFECTRCRPDQEIVSACTLTRNTECRCRAGWFCAPEQACEACRKCSGCEQDEEMVRNCTSTANAECKQVQPEPGSFSASASVILPLLALVPVALLIVACVWNCRRAKGSRGTVLGCLKPEQHDGPGCPPDDGRTGDARSLSCSSLILSRQLVRARSPVPEEREVLCGSFSSSASNSQLSLTSRPPRPPQAGPAAVGGEETFPQLVALNGEESLRKCFDYFEDVDMDYHKRFFRQLGIQDNVIKSKGHLTYEDKVHELLNVWVEKEGRDASLNVLLGALLDLGQRRTAETVKEKAVRDGHYLSQE
ncbi:tumor necrosis factor receptor superfamily member 10A-like isoform X1 [Brachionichthys hirsutus]|uniref:tumor necrosis factor receptor superfamily member 10A-like isoform X1 n=1 Tax=Brachionichthys hirsutus TaxID=412623 RepID=UPI003604DE3F